MEGLNQSQNAFPALEVRSPWSFGKCLSDDLYRKHQSDACHAGAKQDHAEISAQSMGFGAWSWSGGSHIREARVIGKEALPSNGCGRSHATGATGAASPLDRGQRRAVYRDWKA